MCSDWDRMWGNCKDEKHPITQAAEWAGDRLGISPEAVGGLILGGPLGAAAVEGVQAVGDALKPPDYSGAEGAAQKALDDEKRKRGLEANRQDLQASQLARLFLNSNGAQEETFNFMGL